MTLMVNTLSNIEWIILVAGITHIKDKIAADDTGTPGGLGKTNGAVSSAARVFRGSHEACKEREEIARRKMNGCRRKRKFVRRNRV